MSPTTTAADTTLPVPRIFVSATTGDLGSVRRSVANGLRGIGALAVEQEYFAPPGQTIAAMLEEKIKSCQAVIHIAGHRYGAEDENAPPALRGATYAEGRRSYTQLEHDLALKHGKRLYVFLCADAFPYDSTDTEPAAQQTLQTDHRQRLLASSHFRNEIASGDDLHRHIAKLDEQIRTIAEELGRARRRQRIAIGIGAAAIAALAAGGWHLAGRTDIVEKATAETKQSVIETGENISAVMRELQTLKASLSTASPLTSEIVKNDAPSALTAGGSGAADPIRAARTEVMKQLGITEPELDTRLAGEKNALTDLLTALRTLKPTAVNELTAARHFTREVLRKLGKAEEAAIHYGAATRHYEEAVALYDPKSEAAEWAATQNELLGALLRNGKYDEGLPIAEAALEALEQTLGKENPDTLTSLSNLALMYLTKGDIAKAEPLYLRALESRERTLGKEHPDTLISVNSLATLYDTKGDIAKAEPLYLRALEARERTLGKEHPKTLISLNNLALLYANKGDTAKAEPLYLQAIAASERTPGKEHPNTLVSVVNLGKLYCNAKDFAKAEPLCRRATDGARKVLGDDHPQTLRSTYWLAVALHGQSKDGEAKSLAKEAHTGLVAKFGAEHPHTKDVAALLRELGETP
jgi:Tfp pilus assembly protein PilF